MSWLGALPQAGVQPWGTPSIAPPQQAPEPFLWGQGGARMTPEDIAFQRKLAAQQTQADFSPVGHWLQGAARLADNVAGRFREGRVEKAAERNAAESDAVLKALMSGGGGTDAVTAALTNPYVNDQVRDFAKMQFEVQNRKQAQPHYWETNDGSLGMIGPDGKPVILYKDPTPKINWIQADNGDGTKQLIPVGPNGPMTQGGGGPASTGPGATQPPSTLPPDFDFGEGGPASRAPASFR